MKLKVGSRLLTARQDRKISQQDMADLLGISQSVYSRLERNDTSANLEQLMQFSKTLQIPIQEFLPEIFSINSNHQNNHNGQGWVLGNVYYYSDKETDKLLEMKDKEIEMLQSEIHHLKHIIELLEEKKS